MKDSKFVVIVLYAAFLVAIFALKPAVYSSDAGMVVYDGDTQDVPLEVVLSMQTYAECGESCCGWFCFWGSCSSCQGCNALGCYDNFCNCAGCAQCTPGETRSCGGCAVETCTSGCKWGTCVGSGVCTPGTTSSTSCGSGNCAGTKTRTCQSNCQWGDYGDCSTKGNWCATSYRDSGSCSYSSTCANSGTYTIYYSHCNAAGSCVEDSTGTGTCFRNTDGTTCGNCGTCSGGSCTGQGCTPGSTTTCANAQGCTKTITCDSSCQWPSCPSSTCTIGATSSTSCAYSEGACAGTRTRTCLSTCEWGNYGTCSTNGNSCGNCGTCSNGACTNQGVCYYYSPTDREQASCGNCGIKYCTSSCTWGTCIDKKVNGATCSTGSECCGGYCCSGICSSSSCPSTQCSVYNNFEQCEFYECHWCDPFIATPKTLIGYQCVQSSSDCEYACVTGQNGASCASYSDCTSTSLCGAPCVSSGVCNSNTCTCSYPSCPSTETGCSGGNCCGNGIDDDCDGVTDCSDSDCNLVYPCTPTACGSGYASCYSFPTSEGGSCPDPKEGPISIGGGCCWNFHHVADDGPLTRCCYSNYDETKSGENYCGTRNGVLTYFRNDDIYTCTKYPGGWLPVYSEVSCLPSGQCCDPACSTADGCYLVMNNEKCPGSVCQTNCMCSGQVPCIYNSECNTGYCCTYSVTGIESEGVCLPEGTVFPFGGKSYLCDPILGFTQTQESSQRKTGLLEFLLSLIPRGLFGFL